IPDTVTEIDEYAFRDCSSLKSIEIPSGVTEIKNDIFKDCTSLRQVKLGDNVTKIGSRAFSGCTVLDDIQIPAAVEKLGSYAFKDCTSLKSVTIPVACKEIDGLAFDDCTALTRAELHCETVGISAFGGCTALTDVTLGDEVRTIETGAFMYCTALTEIVIPDGVTTLEPAFSNCSNLRTVTIGDGVDAIDANAFRNCYNLRSVTIGSGVKEIKSYAFSACLSLLSITIPSNVETIMSSAFSGCSKLREVYNLSQASYNFGSSVTVHTDAADDSILHRTDDGFTFREYNDETSMYMFLMDYWGDSEDVVLPDSYNGESYSIAAYALAYNPRLKSVKFSAGVNNIGKEILLGSDNVTSLTVDSDNPVYSSAGNCVIGYYKKFVLGCKTSVIPTDGSVISIGSYVFCGNAAIKEFSIPDSVTSIDYYAFDGCTGITRTVGHVKYVDKWAIGLESYSGEEKLDLELESGTAGITDRAFESRNSIGSIKFNPELKYVGVDAFYCCVNLTEVVMNDGLLKIGSSAFFDCEKLQDVVVPDSVKTMGWYAFDGCSYLKYVKLSAGLAEIGGYSFKDCTALESVVIPQSVTFVSREAFLGCPETVKIYYEGTEEQWNEIYISTIDNAELITATKYFYSETEIEGVNCWHYDADGKPTTIY
ncbi:MAG: leucine-rich repeat domain-containing protein, partial [Clostridiales bacterium]|nr:leucine-rich repeat domain-containing protein [Clostridiales bacterium]